MNRRNLLKRAFALGVVAALPLAVSALPATVVAAPDEWDHFIERVRLKVGAITAREGRVLHRMCIDPPRASADGTFYTRRVRIHLEAGGSLLQKVYFEWDEPYCSRWNGEDL